MTKRNLTDFEVIFHYRNNGDETVCKRANYRHARACFNANCGDPDIADIAIWRYRYDAMGVLSCKKIWWQNNLRPSENFIEDHVEDVVVNLMDALRRSNVHPDFIKGMGNK
jgi:hypothetical protein